MSGRTLAEKLGLRTREVARKRKALRVLSIRDAPQHDGGRCRSRATYATCMKVETVSAAKLHDLLVRATRTAFRAARDAHANEGLYVFGLYMSAAGQLYATFNTRAEARAGARWRPAQFVYHARNRVLFAEVAA